MGSLKEARPNLVLLVRFGIVFYLFGSNVAPATLIHQRDNRPVANRDPHQNHDLKRQTPKTGAHTPEDRLLPANRASYRLVLLPQFASTPTTSKVENCTSRPRNQTLLQP